MTNPFFDHPILNSPYECPPRHWELDDDGQPTQQILETRRPAKFITPIPKPKKRKGAAKQDGFVFEDAAGLSTKEQQYDPTSIINEVRGHVDIFAAGIGQRRVILFSLRGRNAGIAAILFSGALKKNGENSSIIMSILLMIA